MQPLLTPLEVDELLRYPRGRSVRLAKEGKIPFVMLPDGELRFDREYIEALLKRAYTGSEPKPKANAPGPNVAAPSTATKGFC